MEIRDLHKIMQDMIQHEQITQVNLKEVDVRTRAAWGALITASEQTLEKLALEWREAIHETGIAIFLSGSPQNVKSWIAQAKKLCPDTVHVDASELYTRIAEPIDIMLGSDHRVISSAHGARLIAELGDIARSLDMSSIPSPATHLLGGIHLGDFDAVLGWVRGAIRGAAGDDLNSTYLFRKITDAAKKAQFMKDVVPVIVTGFIPEETFGTVGVDQGRPLKDLLFKRKSIVVELTRYNPDDVLQVMEKTRASLVTNKPVEAVEVAPQAKGKRGRPAKKAELDVVPWEEKNSDTDEVTNNE